MVEERIKTLHSYLIIENELAPNSDRTFIPHKEQTFKLGSAIYCNFSNREKPTGRLWVPDPWLELSD